MADKDKKDTAKAAATGAQVGATAPQPPMPSPSNSGKKPLWFKAWEIFQSLLIVLGFRQSQLQDQEKRKKLPIWVLSLVSEWTREDEDRFKNAVDNGARTAGQFDQTVYDRFMDFVEWAIEKESYDFLTIKLSFIRWHEWYQAEKDRKDAVNSAAVTVHYIANAHGNRKEQEKRGKRRGILIKIGPVKAYFGFLRRHKLVSLFILFFTVLILLIMGILLLVAVIWFTIWCTRNANAITNWLSYFWQLIIWAFTWIDNILDKFI